MVMSSSPFSPTQCAADGRDTVRFRGVFLAISFFYPQGFNHPRPPSPAKVPFR